MGDFDDKYGRYGGGGWASMTLGHSCGHLASDESLVTRVTRARPRSSASLSPLLDYVLTKPIINASSIWAVLMSGSLTLTARYLDSKARKPFILR